MESIQNCIKQFCLLLLGKQKNFDRFILGYLFNESPFFLLFKSWQSLRNLFQA